MAARGVIRYAAFSEEPSGGNPAGVVLGAGGMSDDEMLAVARDVGYSETAFLESRDDGEYDVRYFSALAEVPFCGHATIASGVALAEQGNHGELLFHTRTGPVKVKTARTDGGKATATLTSVAPRVEEVAPADLAEALESLGWAPGDLDPALPPRVANAGASHLVLAAGSRERLRALDYDFDRLKRLMDAREWTTAQLVWREGRHLFRARDPFPVGGVVEDPATGAAAAAFGAYLRELGLVDPPATVMIVQGEDLGRPGRLRVDIPADRAGIDVTGTAVQIDAPPAGPDGSS
jgi:PhzF family phenazine biosynthesis protein